MKVKNRDLGAIEKVFWMLDQVSQVHFAFAAEINTVCTEMEWRTAIDATQLRHPLLSASIRGGDKVQPYFDFSGHVKIPVRWVESRNDDDKSWITEIETELSAPFDWSLAPLIRIAIIGYKNRSVIVIAAHHCIADGVGMSLVIRDIVSALAGQPLLPLPLPLSGDEHLKLLESVQSAGSTEQQAMATSIERREEVRPQVSQHVLSESVTQEIINRVKSEGSTVNATLSAALVLAGRKLSENWKDNKVRLVIPVSTRQALAIGEDCGLFITKKTIGFESDEIDLWDMAKKVNAEIAQINTFEAIKEETKGLRQLLFSPMDINDISNLLQSDVEREIMVSNIGRITFDTEIGKFKINALWGPIALSGSTGDQTVGITTINGRMHFLHVSRMPIPGLLAAAVDMLKSLVATNKSHL